MSSKDDYVRKMHARLDQWNAEIDALSAQADQAKAEARGEYHRQIEALRDKQSQARAKLDELQRSGEGAWQDLKAGVEMAWDSMGEAMQSARSRFR